MSPRGRRQPDLPGMERKDIAYPEVEEAAVVYTELCEEVLEERRRLSKRLRLGKQTLLATMHARKIRHYSWRNKNGETEYIELEEVEEKVIHKKTGESDPEIGQGVDVDAEAAAEAADSELERQTGGLIAQAAKAQADAGVAEDESGEVIPRDDPPAKKKRGKSKAKR
jgi:hypothetical protein